nr:unnamed protein product [Callosobruchus analis]
MMDIPQDEVSYVKNAIDDLQHSRFVLNEAYNDAHNCGRKIHGDMRFSVNVCLLWKALMKKHVGVEVVDVLVMNKSAIESGKAYKSRKLKPVPEKAAPSQQVCCKCQFACKSLGYHWRKSLFENFYKQNSHVQGSYLMNLIHLVLIRRRRHGSYENPEESKRQTTVNYTIPGESGDFVQVCKKTVMDTDKRTCHKTSKFSENDRNAIRDHVNSLPRDVGHYTRAKSDKEYLSPDLNLHRLFKAFIKLVPC